jgi:hypothetical protein
MNESGTSDTLASLAAGAREVRWAPRVAPHKIRRLYETDALGLVDEEQIDDVGYALLARCESILEVTAAHRHRRMRCPRCRADVRRHGDPTDPATREEVIRCGACGWATTWRAYHQTYRGKRLFGANAVSAFAAFVRDFARATTPRQRMVAIDQLLHAVHQKRTGEVGRPAAVNVIEGGVLETITLLERLTYGEGNTPGLQEAREAWQQAGRTKPAGGWRDDDAHDDAGDGGVARGHAHRGALAALLAQAHEVRHARGAYHVLAAEVGEAIAPTPAQLRRAADWLRGELGEPVVMILAAVADARPQYLVLVSKELTERGLDANAIVRVLAQEVRGAGGGRPDFAQGGGGDPARLTAGLERARAAAEPGPAP